MQKINRQKKPDFSSKGIKKISESIGSALLFLFLFSGLIECVNTDCIVHDGKCDPLVTFVLFFAGTDNTGDTTIPQVQTLKTNLTQCWDNGGVLLGSCVGTGQDGEHQIGLTRSFTGPTQHATYTSDYTTTDITTGLVWKSCTEGLTGSACGGGALATATWVNATTTTCQVLNTLNAGSGYAGHNNWRLPKIEELGTLVDFAYADTNWFFNNPFPATLASAYWSVSGYDAGNSWLVRFTGDAVDASGLSARNVRCVSSGPWPTTPAFTDNGDGTVNDSATNLVWQKCSRGQNNDATCSGGATTADWTTALNYCNSLGLAGKIWRLPNVNELKSIVDYTVSGPSINAAAFPATDVANFYWSASTNVATPARASNVDFAMGRVYSSNHFKTNTLNVRCVTSRV